MSAISGLYRFARDTGIKAEDIPPTWMHLTPSGALGIKDTIPAGEYISMRNNNNLSEVLIYRRTMFKSTDLSIVQWDGETKNTSWYDADPYASTFQITTPADLAGFSELVASGTTFESKTIKLESNINLNGKPWTPIGRSQEGLIPFKGTFDGGGHGIYNLTITATNENNYDVGFFGGTEGAVIKNVVFENVTVKDERTQPGGVATVCADAKNSMFVSVYVSGTVTGHTCAAITLNSEDTTYYNIINRAEVCGKSFIDNDDIICGGIVGKLSISDKVRASTSGRAVTIFNRCLQEGITRVEVASNQVRELAIGQLYGKLEDTDSSELTGSISIDRCHIRENFVSVKDYAPLNVSEPGFFGKVNGAAYGMNYHDAIDGKIDMLDGLIGKTPMAIGVTVIRITHSTITNNMVIPGSCNTMRSKPHIRSFETTDSSPIDINDGTINMRPYYKFVKRTSI